MEPPDPITNPDTVASFLEWRSDEKDASEVFMVVFQLSRMVLMRAQWKQKMNRPWMFTDTVNTTYNMLSEMKYRGWKQNQPARPRASEFMDGKFNCSVYIRNMCSIFNFDSSVARVGLRAYNLYVLVWRSWTMQVRNFYDIFPHYSYINDPFKVIHAGVRLRVDDAESAEDPRNSEQQKYSERAGQFRPVVSLFGACRVVHAQIRCNANSS